MNKPSAGNESEEKARAENLALNGDPVFLHCRCLNAFGLRRWRFSGAATTTTISDADADTDTNAFLWSSYDQLPFTRQRDGRKLRPGADHCWGKSRSPLQRLPPGENRRNVDRR